ncbi:MAG: transporter [Acidobacteria bacterium]|nr:transporter [Acidobacteriota bacterium]
MTTRYRLLFAALVVLAACGAAHGQELEPRRYVNTPTGANFVAVVYGLSTGNVLLDPSFPVEGLDAELHVVALRYVRSAGLFGKNGRFVVALPASSGDWSGAVDRDLRTRRIDGFGDLRVGATINFIGAPALQQVEFSDFTARTVVGASIQVNVPTGQYDPDRLLNLGSNRWTFIPEIGASHVSGRWTFELTARAWLFTKIRDFFGGNELTQRALLAAQIHSVYTFRPGLWIAGGIGLANGGRTSVNGAARDTFQRNSRFGLVLAYPIARQHGLRATFGASITTTNGADFRTFGFGYQYAW